MTQHRHADPGAAFLELLAAPGPELPATPETDRMVAEVLALLELADSESRVVWERLMGES